MYKNRLLSLITFFVMAFIIIIPVAGSFNVLAENTEIKKNEFGDILDVKAPNAILLSTFETGSIENWFVRGSAMLSSVNTEAHSGKYALEVKGRGKDDYHGPAIDITKRVKKGEEYNVSIWLKMAKGVEDTSLKCTLEKTDDDGKGYPQIGSTIATSGEWTQLSASFIANWQGELRGYTLNIETLGGVGKSFYMDEVYMGLSQYPVPDLSPNTLKVRKTEKSLVRFTTPVDIKDGAYEKAVEFLMALNIMEPDKDNLFKPDDFITRAEFAATITKVLGLADEVEVAKGKETLFYDVAEDYWAVAEIRVASEHKLINGYSNGDFGPEDLMNYEQIIKVLVCALGYQVHAEQQGGYPMGYLAIGSQQKIIKDVPALYGAPANRGNAAKLIYNAMHAQMLTQVQFGNTPTYSTNKDTTIMSETLKIIKADGQITGNLYTRLQGESSLNSNEVEIKNNSGEYNTFQIGSTNADKFLGYNVAYYYKDDKDQDTKELLYVALKADKNLVLKINASDISSYTPFSYKYIKGSGDTKDEETAKISNSADVIFNSKAYTMGYTNESVFKPTSGEVILIDTNSDGSYDLVDITSWKTFVVGSKSEQDFIIYDKFNLDTNTNTITLDKSDATKKLDIVDFDGNSTDFSSISDWSVVCVTQTLPEQSGKPVIRATVVKQKIKGTIQEIADADTKDMKYKIEDTEYGVSNYLLENISKEIILNDKGTFYFDIEGKLVAADITSSEGKNIGYLLDASVSKDVNSRLEIKVLNTKGNFVVFRSADKIKVDGTSMTDFESARATLTFTNAKDGVIKRQLLSYDLNANNELIAIDKPINPNDTSTDSYVLQRIIGNGTNTMIKFEYRQSPKLFWIDLGTNKEIDPNTSKNYEGRFFGADSGIVFNVEQQSDTTNNVYTKKNFSTIKMSALSTKDPGNYYSLDLFKINTIHSYVDFAVKTDTTTDVNDSPGNTDLLFAVSKIVSIDNDGEQKFKIYLTSTKEVNYIVKDGCTVYDDTHKQIYSDISQVVFVGDIVRVHVNRLSEVDYIERMVSKGQNVIPNYNIAAPNNEKIIVFGYVYDKNPDGIIALSKTIINAPSDSEKASLLKNYIFRGNKFKIYVIDTSKSNPVTKGSYGDIVAYTNNPNSYSKVCFRMNYDGENEMFVFK